MVVTRTPLGAPLQSVACDLCGSAKDQTYITLSDLMTGATEQVYRFARCRACGLMYLNPRPYEWDLHAHYPESYAPFKRKRLSEKARNWLHRRSVSELSHQLGPGNRVLDLGCGTGELLEQIRRGGNADLVGIEPSEQAASIARTRRGLDVRTGTLEQAGLPGNSIDTVLLSHVLEHLPSPSRTMQSIEKVLKPGGAVIIWVPNARSLAAQVLGPYWMGWDAPRHLYAFTPGSLYRLTEKAGLIPGTFLHEKHAIEWAWGLRLYGRAHFDNPQIETTLARFHPFLAAMLTPLGVVSAGMRRSGRIRMIARKPVV